MMKGLYIGGVFNHPEQGPIRIDSGKWEEFGRISNYWYWTVVATGEKKSGYGGNWEDVSDQYVTITIPKTQLGL